MRSLKIYRLLKVISLLLIMGLTPATAYSYGTIIGRISYFQYLQTIPNVVFLYFDTPSTGGPVCATVTSRVSLDISTMAGKAMYSHLLTLKTSDPTVIVTLYGTGTCTLKSNTEDVFYANIG